MLGCRALRMGQRMSGIWSAGEERNVVSERVGKGKG